MPSDAPTGTVAGLWIAEADAAPMQSRDAVEAVPGGLDGDRYQRGTGYYSPYDVCEVTLIAGEAIDTVAESFDIDLTDGRHRRNVVTGGIDLSALLDHRFGIGDAVLEGTRPRPPCAHVEEVAGEEELMAALGGDRGGVCADVIEPGEIRVGDGIRQLDSTALDPDELAASIRDRHE